MTTTFTEAERERTAVERAATHTLTWSGPTPRFLDGALLGNGALGATVTTRPDAVVLHFGHNDVWDKRIDESHKDHVLTFDDVFARVEKIDPAIGPVENDPWFAEYRARMVESYAKPYPRPLPCGSLVLGIDRRHTDVIGHELDIATGLCTIELQHRGTTVYARVFVNQDGRDNVHVKCVSESGETIASPFVRLRLLPDPEGPAVEQKADGAATTFILPRPSDVPIRAGVRETDLGAHGLGFSELLPSLGAGIDEPLGEIDLRVWTTADFVEQSRPSWYGPMHGTSPLERALVADAPFEALIELRYAYGTTPETSPTPPDWASAGRDAYASSVQDWAEYWSKSSISLSDSYLERVWYVNTYFAHCAIREGASAPGLFGNWMYRGYGAAWHGDYHMNYNAQQVYWGTFSSNRVEQHLPYVDLVERMAPVARSWARDYYGMRGAAYPHSAYNTDMTVNPYPNPVWAWELSESPWTVQSLWWHYQFTQDTAFLRDRALPLIEDVVLFLVDYLSREQTHGDRWNDDLTHIYPTVPPELYGLAPGLMMNRDCLLDIALVKFTFNAYTSAHDALEREIEAELGHRMERILQTLPEYPTADTSEGTVFVSVPGEHPDTVYNVPVPGMTVFPGEDHSWESDEETLEIARRSVRNQLIEGGNDLVFANLQAARLGILDLARFTRQLRYCELPNGTFTDMVLQVHGRYNDATTFEFMADKGVWTENFALTAVINELLLQSYSGTIRVFANCGDMEWAHFESLRAPGAFLISSTMSSGTVTDIRVRSEAGSTLRILVPWEQGAVLSSAGRRERLPGGIVEIETRRGEEIVLSAS